MLAIYVRNISVSFSLILFCALSASAQTKTLGLTKKINGNDENGYILFSPIGVDTTYLMNKCGQKIHSWHTQYTPGLSVYLQPNGHLLKCGTYTDTVFGFAGGRGGMIEEYDWNGSLLWSYKVFNDSLCQHHDIRPLPNGNILVLAWHAISKNQAINLGRSTLNFSPNQADLWGERIVEIKPHGTDSAEVIWQWDMFDHIIQDLDSTLPNYGNVASHPELMDINYALNLQTNDWIHANSLDYNADLDQIVISAHNISEIWIIDHSTSTAEAAAHYGGTHNKGGDFLYRWGNPQAYRMGNSSDRKLFRQHNAHWIPNGYRDSGCILLFNNGWGRDTAYSTVDVIQTPILSNGSYNFSNIYGPSAAKWVYKDSVKTKFYSQIISGAQMLPNGNVLICSGVQGRFFEVTSNKQLVWQYRNPVTQTGIQSDGQTPGNNSVFRCSYYPKNYAAFNGKSLPSLGTIEANSYPYSCHYETVPPKITAVFPKLNDSLVLPSTVLTIKTDESVLRRNSSITIFANGQVYETIATNSDLVKVKNDSVFIHHLKPFPVNSRIGVLLPRVCFSDSSNNYLLTGKDSASWHFKTIRAQPVLQSIWPAHQSLGVKPSTKIRLTYNERLFKRNIGTIQLFENGNIKESIAVGSVQIQIYGNVVEIIPSVSFAMNAFISLSMDSCFKDTFGIATANATYGNWYFRTAALPTVSVLSPVLNAQKVQATAPLQLTFNKLLQVDSIKSIKVYENGLLKNTLALNDLSLLWQGNQLTWSNHADFAKGARIAVAFPSNALVDSLGYRFAGLDTAQWHFTVEANSDLNTVQTDAIHLYPNPVQDQLTVSSIEITSAFAIDVLGKKWPLALEVYENNTTLSVMHLPQGLYVLYLNGNLPIKFIKH